MNVVFIAFRSLFQRGGIVLLFCCLFAALAPAVQDKPLAGLGVEVRKLPALYKTNKGRVQKVQLIVAHPGKPATALPTWNGTARKEKLLTGENRFLPEIPPVRRPAQAALLLSCNNEQIKLKEGWKKGASNSRPCTFTGIENSDYICSPRKGNSIK